MRRLLTNIAGAALAEVALGVALAGAAVVVGSIGLNAAVQQAVAQDRAVQAGTAVR
ncbi:hypothetical protein OMW55_08580 [Sphingomonas sp. BN140010]|uniref:Uncharacterized protein n=1 Tax=Sphingomonas arvum TaxID=2992113 RepID=A0ABT3JFK6_9SPHN|nr:hypothetical protein [Sphingomonas sp. BN140010]MCW3797857.1 hypothetical protein [Sphingomonas sp. BN140010]